MSDYPDNDDRAAWAYTAVRAFGEETGQIDYDMTDREAVMEIAGDLICNLFHLVGAAGVTPEELVDRARMHYDAEVDDEDEEER